jgi:hypothetical protein
MTDAELLATFETTFREGATANGGAWSGNVWATATNLGALRWSYLLSIDTSEDLSITLQQLEASPETDYLVWEFWKTNGTGAPRLATAVRWKNGGAFTVPKSPPASAVLPPSSSGTYQIVSPILESGWCLVGEGSKFVPVSARRFRSVGGSADSDGPTLRVTVDAASGESVTVWLLTPAATKTALLDGARSGKAVAITPLQITCTAPKCLGEDCVTKMVLACYSSSVCNCVRAEETS